MTRYLILSVFALALSFGPLGAELSYAQTASVSTKKSKKKSEDKPLVKMPGRWQSGPKPSDAAAKKMRACMERRDILEQARDRLDYESNNLQGVDAEIAELERRLTYLKKEKRRAEARTRNQQNRVKRLSAVYDKECKGGDSCARTEKRVASLERAAQPLEAELTDLGRGIREGRVRIGQLRGDIRILRDDYKRLRCGSLVPGQTTQATIDRCSEIFSDWNRTQQELDRYSRNLTSMRTRYRNIKSRLDSLTASLNSAEAYLARNCKESSARETIRTRKTTLQRAEALFRELEAMSKDLDDARSITILE